MPTSSVSKTAIRGQSTSRRHCGTGWVLLLKVAPPGMGPTPREPYPSEGGIVSVLETLSVQRRWPIGTKTPTRTSSLQCTYPKVPDPIYSKELAPSGSNASSRGCHIPLDDLASADLEAQGLAAVVTYLSKSGQMMNSCDGVSRAEKKIRVRHNVLASNCLPVSRVPR